MAEVVDLMCIETQKYRLQNGQYQPSSLMNAASLAVLIHLDSITPIHHNIAPICSRHIAELIGTAEQSSEDVNTATC